MTEPIEIDTRGPLRTFYVSLGEIGPDSLSFGELLDVGDATGIDPDAMGAVIRKQAGRGTDRLRLLCAFAWIIARRTEPDLTYADILAGRVDVRDEQPDPARVRRARARARRVMAVSSVTGLPPREVEALTVAQTEAAAALRTGTGR